MSQLRRSERVTFEGGSGYQLAGIVDQPEGTPKAFAVFMHCFTCTKDIKLIVRISRGLAASGFGVLRFDSTGLGDSQGDFSRTGFSSNRADVLAAVRFLSEQFGEPQFLIGHSFGGAASLSTAQEIPSIAAVASIAGPSDTIHLAALLERMNPKIASEGRGEVSIGGKRHLITQQMLDDFRGSRFPEIISRLSKPVMLMHSPVDETLGFEHAVRLYQLLTVRSDSDTAPCATSLICLDGADHLLTQRQSDIGFIVRILAAWFERVGGEG